MSDQLYRVAVERWVREFADVDVAAPDLQTAMTRGQMRACGQVGIDWQADRPVRAKDERSIVAVALKVPAAAVLLLLAMALPAAAQVRYDFDRIQPGDVVADRPGCTWQWNQFTVGDWGGWYQACAQPALPAQQALPEATPPPAPVPPAGHACGAYNPYTDPAGMMACIAAQPPAPLPQLPPIHVGQRYHLAYSSLQVQVLSVVASLDGVQVITYQWLVAVVGHDAGDVSACRYGSTTGRSTCPPFIPMQ